MSKQMVIGVVVLIVLVFGVAYLFSFMAEAKTIYVYDNDGSGVSKRVSTPAESKEPGKLYCIKEPPTAKNWTLFKYDGEYYIEFPATLEDTIRLCGTGDGVFMI